MLEIGRKGFCRKRDSLQDSHNVREIAKPGTRLAIVGFVHCTDLVGEMALDRIDANSEGGQWEFRKVDYWGNRDFLARKLGVALFANIHDEVLKRLSSQPQDHLCSGDSVAIASVRSLNNWLYPDVRESERVADIPGNDLLQLGFQIGSIAEVRSASEIDVLGESTSTCADEKRSAALEHPLIGVDCKETAKKPFKGDLLSHCIGRHAGGSGLIGIPRVDQMAQAERIGMREVASRHRLRPLGRSVGCSGPLSWRDPGCLQEDHRVQCWWLLLVACRPGRRAATWRWIRAQSY